MPEAEGPVAERSPCSWPAQIHECFLLLQEGCASQAHTRLPVRLERQPVCGSTRHRYIHNRVVGNKMRSLMLSHLRKYTLSLSSSVASLLQLGHKYLSYRSCGFESARDSANQVFTTALRYLTGVRSSQEVLHQASRAPTTASSDSRTSKTFVGAWGPVGGTSAAPAASLMGSMASKAISYPPAIQYQLSANSSWPNSHMSEVRHGRRCLF